MLPFTPHTTLRLNFGLGGSLVGVDRSRNPSLISGAFRPLCYNFF